MAIRLSATRCECRTESSNLQALGVQREVTQLHVFSYALPQNTHQKLLRQMDRLQAALPFWRPWELLRKADLGERRQSKRSLWPVRIRRLCRRRVLRGDSQRASPRRLGHRPSSAPDHAAYIASWPEVLKDDSCAIFTAASEAQQAADWMHAQQHQTDGMAA